MLDARGALRCGDPLPPSDYQRLVQRAIFDCFKWHVQHGDHDVLCPFPLVLTGETWRALAEAAERLSREALSAEIEIAGRRDLSRRLGLSDRLSRVLDTGASPSPSGPRFSRFDFHPTEEGFQITEGNIDVAGGLIEGSGVTAMMAEAFPALRPAGDPAAALAAAIGASVVAGGRVGLMHLTQYTEDHQIALYLAKRLREIGISTHAFNPAELRFRHGRAEALSRRGSVPLDLVYRFFPAEWLERLPAVTRWPRVVLGGRTPFTNPGTAVLTQSKRFPLVWGDLTSQLPTWRALLPETRSPEQAGGGGEWVIKPALGHEGDRVAMAGVTEDARYADITRAAAIDPSRWVAQRRFAAKPIETPSGPRYPSVGVFVLDGEAVGAYARLAPKPLIDDGAQEVIVLVERDS